MAAIQSRRLLKPSPPHQCCTFGDYRCDLHSVQVQSQGPLCSQRDRSVLQAAALGPLQRKLRLQRHRRKLSERWRNLSNDLSLASRCQGGISSFEHPRSLIISTPTYRGGRPEPINSFIVSECPRASANHSQFDFNTMGDTPMNEEFLDDYPGTNSNTTWLGGPMYATPQSFNSLPNSNSSSTFSSPILPESEGFTLSSGVLSTQTFECNAIPFSMQATYPPQLGSFHETIIENRESWASVSPSSSYSQGSGSIDQALQDQSQPVGKYNCWCGKMFDSKHGTGNFLRHIKSVHTPKEARKPELKCDKCDVSFSRMDGKKVHDRRKHPKKDLEEGNGE